MISSIDRTTTKSQFKGKSYKEINVENISKQLSNIQDVIRKFDINSIESAYFYEHPITIHELNKLDDITIGEFKSKMSKKFRAFVERLRNMEIKNDSGKQGVLFVYKSQVESLFLETDGSSPFLCVNYL